MPKLKPGDSFVLDPDMLGDPSEYSDATEQDRDFRNRLFAMSAKRLVVTGITGGSYEVLDPSTSDDVELEVGTVDRCLP